MLNSELQHTTNIININIINIIIMVVQSLLQLRPPVHTDSWGRGEGGSPSAHTAPSHAVTRARARQATPNTHTLTHARRHQTLTSRRTAAGYDRGARVRTPVPSRIVPRASPRDPHRCSPSGGGGRLAGVQRGGESTAGGRGGDGRMDECVRACRCLRV